MSTQGSITFPFDDKFVCIAIRHTADLIMPLLLKHCSTNESIELIISDVNPGFSCGISEIDIYLEKPENRMIGVGDDPISALKNLGDLGGLPNYFMGCHYDYLRVSGGWIEEWTGHESSFHVNPSYPLPVVHSPYGFRDISGNTFW